jgi:hypothetical protein
VEERRLRIGSLFEWLAAALALAGVIWVIYAPIQRMLGPRVEASLVDVPAALPPGVPAGASSIPVLLLLDGREIRYGLPHNRLLQILPDTLTSDSPMTRGGKTLTTAPVLRSSGEFGERQTRTYTVDGRKFYVVCERRESGGPLRVAGIYIP